MERLVRWLERPRIQRWILILLLILAAGSFGYLKRGGDFKGYIQVGHLVLEGKWIYFNPYINTWPPFVSVFFVPFALLDSLSKTLVRAGWIVVNLFTLYVSLRLIAKMLYDSPPAISSPEIFIPFVLTGRYILTNFQYLQINIPLFAMVLGGLALQKRRREMLGGLLIGCAAAIKIMSVIFIPYFLFRRKWRIAAWTSIWTVLLSLSPILVFGWTRFWEYVNAWLKIASNAWTVGRMNQSVFAMFDRFIGQRMLPFTTEGIQILPRSGDPMVVVAWAITFAVVAVAIWCVFGKHSESRYTELCEWSALFIIAAIFGSVAWKAFLVILLLPHALLFAVWRNSTDAIFKRIALGVMTISFVVGSFTGPALIGKQTAGVLDMSSIITITVLLILVGILTIRSRLPHADSRPVEDIGQPP